MANGSFDRVAAQVDVLQGGRADQLRLQANALGGLVRREEGLLAVDANGARCQVLDLHARVLNSHGGVLCVELQGLLKFDTTSPPWAATYTTTDRYTEPLFGLLRYDACSSPETPTTTRTPCNCWYWPHTSTYLPAKATGVSATACTTLLFKAWTATTD